MSIEDNKKLVVEFLAKLSAQDFEDALGMMHDDATWWVGGKPELFSIAGLHSKAQITEILYQTAEPMPNGIEMRLRATTAEGERVAAEVESYGEATDGRVYNNEYHFLFVVRDGKLAEIREYMDQMHAKAVFLDP